MTADGSGPDGLRAPRRASAQTGASQPVTTPIRASAVVTVASEGFPLWEPVEVMVLRNRRITVAYGELSNSLARTLALDPAAGVLDANWCTFGTWSSKTIGGFIELIPDTGDDESVELAGPLPGRATPWWRTQLAALPSRLIQRSNGASHRALAAGNRIVFLEIGQALADFVERFGTTDGARGEHPTEAAWDAYWSRVENRLDRLAQLDPSWLLTPGPKADDLRLGLRQYFLALSEPDPGTRSQRVLAGNLLIGAYEQRRVDGYVWAALALFTERAMRRLIRDRTGDLSGVRRWLTGAYAVAMTRRMRLDTPDERLRVGRPIPPAPDPQDPCAFPARLDDVTLPVLQALITRYELAVGRTPVRRGARNWTSFDERMGYIGTLFRLRHRRQILFTDPFTPEDTARLLKGELAPDT